MSSQVKSETSETEHNWIYGCPLFGQNMIQTVIFLWYEAGFVSPRGKGDRNEHATKKNNFAAKTAEL